MSRFRTTCLTVLAVVLGMGLVSCAGGPTIDAVPTQSGVQAPDSEAAKRAGTAPPEKISECHNPETVYSGTICFQGGEWATVTRVIDGDTVELADGRTVRLLGIDTPEADTCAGPGATEFTRAHVEGQKVKLIREPGVTTDQYGRELAYVQYAGAGMSSSTYGTVYGSDLGHELTTQGWAEPYPGDANAEYMGNIITSYETVRHLPYGMNAAPCGSPDPYPYETDGHTYVPVPDSGGDGDDGESKFCRGRWYC